MALIANICGIVGWLFLIYSYYKEDIDDLLYLQILSAVFYCLNYMFLDADIGLIICFFELVKTILYYKTDKDDLIFKFSLPVYFIIGIFSLNPIVDILPVIGSVIDSFGMSKNRFLAVGSSALANILWVIYDVLIGAYSVAITDFIVVLSNISILLVGQSRIIKSKKLKLSRYHFLSNSTFKTITDLDKKNYNQEYLWDEDYQKQIYLANKDSFIFIKYRNDIVGYINYLTITEKKYDDLLLSNKFLNYIEVDDISKLSKTAGNYVNIESISVDKNYQNFKTIAKIKNSFERLIHDNYSKNIKFNGFISIACSKFEEDVLEELGFQKEKELEDGNSLYVLNKSNIYRYYLSTEFRKNNEKNKYKIVLNENISDDMLKQVYDLDKEFFKKEYLWDFNYQKEIYEKNKNSFVFVLYEDRVVGYINYLCITEQKNNEILNSNCIIDNYSLDDIQKYKKSIENYITINSIVIDKEFQNGITIKLLTDAFKKEIKRLLKNKYKIKMITSTAISKDGRKALEQLSLKKYKDLDNKNVLYIFDKF